MSSVLSPDYRVALLTSPGIEETRRLWRELESRTEPHFFLTWHWIGTWLAVMRPAYDVLAVYHQDVIVALGCLSKPKWRYRLGLPIARQVYLHETGDPKRDQQWIEYNGLLAEEPHKVPATETAVSFLLRRPGWDELVVGVARSVDLEQFNVNGVGSRHVRWESASHSVDLRSIDPDAGCVSGLSRNTRYQINRARKLYAAMGPIKITRAQSSTQALAMLEQAASFHIQRWGTGTLGSGFSNDRFVEFHKRLIVDCFDAALIDVLCVSAGDHVLGYFYNFLYRRRVYFYLSSLPAVSDNKQKPGLLCHSLLIDHYAAKGFEVYDFMGGGESYKDRLATRSGEVARVAFQRKRPLIRIENVARSLKHLRESDT